MILSFVDIICTIITIITIINIIVLLEIVYIMGSGRNDESHAFFLLLHLVI